MPVGLESSVIIPTYNRAADLQECLTALAAQSLAKDRFEVIVVDDGSRDDTWRTLQGFDRTALPGLRALRQENRGPAAARNLGIRHARAPWIAFTDDDCVPNRDWLASLIDVSREDADIAGWGGVCVRYRESRISRYMDDSGLMRHPAPDGEVLYLVTANAMYRTDTLLACGGFCEQFTWPGGEDPELSYRLRRRGCRLGLAPAAVVRHKHRDTWRGLWRLALLYGRGAVDVYMPPNAPPPPTGASAFLAKLAKVFCYIGRADLPLGDRAVFQTCQLVLVAGMIAGIQRMRWRGKAIQSPATLPPLRPIAEPSSHACSDS